MLRVALIYIFPTINAAEYVPMAKRFVMTYYQHPPGITPHSVVVAVNGSETLMDWCKSHFDGLHCEYLAHNNYGKDIGAYFAAADQIDCDLMVCMGTPVHFHRSGWLDRMVEAYLEHGPAMYGPWGFHFPLPHLRTTCFWIPPELLLGYPHQVDDRGRYAFEHGPQSITQWTQQQGFEPRMVTWNRVLEMPQWETIGREDSLVIDQHINRWEGIRK